MRMSLSRPLLRRLGRTTPCRHVGAPALPDPADMGTEFGLEAMLAPLPAADAPGTAGEEAPLAWLGRTAAQHTG